MEEKNSDESIKIYMRIRPTVRNTNHINLVQDKNIVEVTVPKNEKHGYVNHSKEKHQFKFNKLYDMSTKQQQIFDEVARDVVDSAIEGYNGTIFAYGQTGSGKTYTITGGAERAQDKGIIPRALSYIFMETSKKTEYTYSIYVSYLEIYNNEAYDLLPDKVNAKTLEDLPKVQIFANKQNQFMLHNLNVKNVKNEEEALYLFMMGDDNRVVAETPKNDVSTRSHCIFTIQIESQKTGEDKKKWSKLHIVDLSGSETPSKTDLNDQRMEEALNINLSLFFLEQVINSLNTKQLHVPYRNSKMTMVLRDSLGGNCKTRMIATISAEVVDMMETINTCRFAQRVAMVKNSAVINEIEDPVVLIQKQKSEIEELKSELALMKGKDQKSFLDEDDIVECKKIIKEYLATDDYSQKITLKDMLMIQECFAQIKILYKTLEQKANNIVPAKNEIVLTNNFNNDRVIELENSNKRLSSEIEKLKDLLRRQDEEMKVLLSMVDKYKANLNDSETVKKITSDSTANLSLLTIIREEDKRLNDIRTNLFGSELKFEVHNKLLAEQTAQMKSDLSQSSIKKSGHAAAEQPSQPVPLLLIKDINTANSYLTKEVSLSKEILSERLRAYDVFKKNYIKTSIKEEYLASQQSLFKKGQVLADEVKQLSAKGATFKSEIERVRKEKILKGIDDQIDPNNPLKILEEEKLKNFTDLKAEERVKLKTLKDIHSEIKSIDASINSIDSKMTKDFEFWYDVMIKKFEYEAKNGKIPNFNNRNQDHSNSFISSSNHENSRSMNKPQDVSEYADRLNRTKNMIFSELNKNA